MLQELLNGLKKKNAEVCIDLAELQEKEMARERERATRLQNAIQALAEKEKGSSDSAAFLQILNTLKQGFEELQSYQQNNGLSPNDTRELQSIAEEWRRLLDSVS